MYAVNLPNPNYDGQPSHSHAVRGSAALVSAGERASNGIGVGQLSGDSQKSVETNLDDGSSYAYAYASTCVESRSQEQINSNDNSKVHHIISAPAHVDTLVEGKRITHTGTGTMGKRKCQNDSVHVQ